MTASRPDLAVLPLQDMDLCFGPASSPLEALLTSAEQAWFRAFRIPKRRREWLGGRLAAKQLIAERHGLLPLTRFHRIETVSTPDSARGKPRYWVDGQPGAFDLSISHSRGVAVAALAQKTGEQVGVDVEGVEARSPGLQRLALTHEEQHRLAACTGEHRWQTLASIWVLKEALCKALGSSLFRLMSSVSVHLGEDGQLSQFVPVANPPDGFAALGRSRAELFDLGGLTGAWVVLHRS
jgi:4'-phosphopantetheinyl transferase